MNRAYNKNFAGQLPILDWMFGTAHMPKANEPLFPIKYGIDAEIGDNYAAHIIGPFLPEKKRPNRDRLPVPQ